MRRFTHRKLVDTAKYLVAIGNLESAPELYTQKKSINKTKEYEKYFIFPF